MSLRSRLTVVAAAAVAAAVLLASALVYVAVRSELRGQIDESLRRGGELLARVPLDPSDGPGGDRPRPGFRVLPAAPLEGIRVYAQLITEDGVAAPGRGGQGLIEPSERAAAVAAGLEGAFLEDAEAGDTHVRVLTQPVQPGFALQIARSLEEVDDTLGRLRWILAAVSFGGIAAAAALGLVVSRSALRPVARLTAAAERVSETRDLTERIEVEGRDEVARLAASFNAMLTALDAAVGAQRQLVTDASHELRTPLTSLRTNIEVLARQPGVPPDERQRLVEDLVAQAEELSALVDDLVELARDEGEVGEPEDVRLDTVAASAVERARRHSPDVVFELIAEPSVVRGYPARIDSAIRNLLDNAAKWSPPGARVEITVADGEVTVRDQGPGIADDDLPHVFDRFYRAASARGLPGSGLGLAIVREVAVSHGGSVAAEHAPGGGALLRLRLGPVATDTGSGDAAQHS